MSASAMEQLKALTKPPEQPKPCALCNAPSEVYAMVQIRRKGVTKGALIATRSLSVCAPCALRVVTFDLAPRGDTP